MGLGTLVPRTWAVRQELEARGQQQPALPLLGEKPGRSKDEACRQWHGHSVIRSVGVEDSDGRVTQAEVRFLVVHARPLRRLPPLPSRSTSSKSRAVVAAAHARGGIMRDATVSSPTPAVRVAGGGDVPPRRTRYHLSQAIA
jgi:hypothetical protein